MNIFGIIILVKYQLLGFVIFCPICYKRWFNSIYALFCPCNFFRIYTIYRIVVCSFYYISGGILVNGNFVGTPKFNLILLLIGTSLASWMGTTGAAMLLIRPLIRANKWRNDKTHIIIFFFFGS